MQTEIYTQAFTRWAWNEVHTLEYLLGGNIASRGLEIDPKAFRLLSILDIHEVIEESLLNKSTLHAAGEHEVFNVYLVLFQPHNTEPDRAVRTVIIRASQHVFLGFFLSQDWQYLAPEVLAS